MMAVDDGRFDQLPRKLVGPVGLVCHAREGGGCTWCARGRRFERWQRRWRGSTNRVMGRGKGVRARTQRLKRHERWCSIPQSNWLSHTATEGAAVSGGARGA